MTDLNDPSQVRDLSTRRLGELLDDGCHGNLRGSKGGTPFSPEFRKALEAEFQRRNTPLAQRETAARRTGFTVPKDWS